MTSNYQDIYSRFLLKIRDYEFANLSEANATEAMQEWLRSSLSKTHIRRIFATLTKDVELGTMEYTMSQTTDDESDRDFVEELLSHQMIVEWLSPRINNITLINQMIFNSKEQKMYSQANHGDMMRNLLADSKSAVRTMLTDRGFAYNSYLGNVT